MRVVICLVVGAMASVPSCKSKEKPVHYPPPPAQDAAPPPPPPPAADAAPPVQDAATNELDPLTLQTLQARVTERAKKDAKGMKPVSGFFGAVVAEGGSVEQTIMIDTGRCYGVVASGEAGVLELDIEIQAKPGLPVPLPGPIIAVDSSQGPEASVSPCWKNTFPLGFPAAVVLKATRGQGPIGGQIYVK
jgi:hypothetical protein